MVPQTEPTTVIAPSGHLFYKEVTEASEPGNEADFGDEETLHTTMTIVLFLIVFALVIIGVTILALPFLLPSLSSK